MKTASDDREWVLHATRGGHTMHTRRTARQGELICRISLSGIRSSAGFPARAAVSRSHFNRAETGRVLSPSIKIFLTTSWRFGSHVWGGVLSHQAFTPLVVGRERYYAH